MLPNVLRLSGLLLAFDPLNLAHDNCGNHYDEWALRLVKSHEQNNARVRNALIEGVLNEMQLFGMGRSHARLLSMLF